MDNYGHSGFNNIYIIDTVLLSDYCFYILFVSLTFYEHIEHININN